MVYFIFNRLHGQVVRASDLQPEGLGFKSSGRVIPKTLKMEPTAIVLGVQHKQWSKENKPVSHNWKKGRGRLDLNQKVGNWAVKLHLTYLLNHIK